MSPLGFSKKLAQDDDGDEEGAMELNDRLRYSKNDQNDIVAQAKTTICDILVTVTKFTTDVRLSYVIQKLKEKLDTGLTKEEILDDGNKHSANDMITEVMDELTNDLDVDKLGPKTDICDVLMVSIQSDAVPQNVAGIYRWRSFY